MSPDELGSEPTGLSGRLPTREAAIETISFLLTLGVLIGGLTLLVTLDLLVRL